MQGKAKVTLTVVAILVAAGAVSAVVMFTNRKKNKTQALATVPIVSRPSQTTTGNTSTAVSPTMLLPNMTDDQARIYAANLPIYNSKDSTQAQRDAAALALYPLINLHLTGLQYSQGHQPGPDSILRKYVAEDYAKIQSGGHAA